MNPMADGTGSNDSIAADPGDLAVYLKLVAEVCRRGIWLNFDGRLGEVEARMHGGFSPRHGAPTITIYRASTAVAEDIVEECITLAHEYGHAGSWFEGFR